MTVQIFANLLSSIEEQRQILIEQLSALDRQKEKVESNENLAKEVITQVENLITSAEGNSLAIDNLKNALMGVFKTTSPLPPAPDKKETQAQINNEDITRKPEVVSEANSQLKLLKSNIYLEKTGLVIITFTNYQRALSWGELITNRMMLCSKFSVISDRRKFTYEKHELHLEGLTNEDIQKLIEPDFNFKYYPEKAFKEVGIAFPSFPEPERKKIEPPLKISDLNVGDIVSREQGTYEVTDISTRDELVTCKCLKHNSFPKIVGEELAYKVSTLKLVEKAKIESGVDNNSNKLPFKVGQQVKILSSRQGEEFVNSEGRITNIGTEGCVVAIGTKIKFYFPNEIQAINVGVKAA